MRNTIAAALALATLTVAASAWAQNDRAFNVQNFETSPGSGAFLTIEGATVPDEIGFRLGGMIGYQHMPLVIRECNAVEGDECADFSDKKTLLVAHHLSLDVLGAISFYEAFEIGVAVPVVLYQTGDDRPATATGPAIAGPEGAAGLGDIRLHLKLDLLHGLFGFENENVGLAIVPVVTLPVGNAVQPDSFMGDSFLTVHPKLAFEVGGGPVRVGLNAGYLWREEKEFYLAEIGPRLTYGAGLEVFMTEGLSGIFELFGSNGFSSDVTESPLEGDLALRYTTEGGVALTAGVGTGIVSGVGTPVFRAFGGVVWAPVERDKDEDGLLDEVDACPEEPEDFDQVEDKDGCPDPDNDRDGFLDGADGCPYKAEDQDGFEDDDGCPDVDNDGDGLMDVSDLCPDEPEDIDGDEDEDGCPEEAKDPDGDGIAGDLDKCPERPEDVDGHEDEDGCPDEDNDGDGIVDAKDACPDEAEVVNEFEDEDGCPDTGKELVVLTKERIKILQKVHFKTRKAKIKKKSHKLLGEVVAVLESHPDIHVRVEGHTDSQGPDNYNKRLSEKRAMAVMTFLIEKGVDPDRLEAVGHGEEKPIDDNKTRQGRAANRRVEFHITKQ
jgi:outer membrane protein OmpA-like peptidoglycan-associated protein